MKSYQFFKIYKLFDKKKEKNSHIAVNEKGKIEKSLTLSLRKKWPYLEFAGPYLPAFGLHTDQKNSEYGQFSRSVFNSILFYKVL